MNPGFLRSDAARVAIPAWVGDVLVVGSAGNGQVPAVARTDGAWCVETSVAGSAVMRWQQPTEHWRGFPALEVAADTGTAVLIGELYGERNTGHVVREISDGVRRAAALNGHFALVVRRADGSVELLTDRFGTVHLYYARRGDGAWVAGTFCPAVAADAACTGLDWEGLAGFLSHGFFPTDRTQLRGVRIAPPASRVLLVPGAADARIEATWRWHHAPDHGRGLLATVDEFAALFADVMRDHLGRASRIAVPISGGLDSRTTVAALPPGNAGDDRLWSYSYGYADDSVEIRIAAQVAAARGLPFAAHTVVPYLLEALPELTAVLEGFQDVTLARQAVVRTELTTRADRVVAAHWGDVWFDAVAPDKLAAFPDPVRLALAMIRKRGADWLIEHVAAPQLGSVAAVEDSNRALVACQLGGLDSVEDIAFRIKAFKTEAWSFRWTLASLRMYQAGAWPLLPFYDTRIADFMATVPHELLRGRHLQIEYLRRHAPDLARIRWQAVDADLFEYPLGRTRRMARRAGRWAARKVRGRGVIQRNWEVQFGGDNGRRGLEKALLSPGAPVNGIVSGGEVRALLDRLVTSPHDPAAGYAVAMLVTLSAWIERYG